MHQPARRSRARLTPAQTLPGPAPAQDPRYARAGPFADYLLEAAIGLTSEIGTCRSSLGEKPGKLGALLRCQVTAQQAGGHGDVAAVEDGLELFHGPFHIRDLQIGGGAKGDEAGQRLPETANCLCR